MAMIDIEYRHSREPPEDAGEIRRASIKIMREYLNDLVCEMQMSDISSKLIVSPCNVPNMVYINGRSVPEILATLDVKLMDADVNSSCDLGRSGIVRFGRPILDWKKDIIEDIPDILIKNAIAKVFAEINDNRIL